MGKWKNKELWERKKERKRERKKERIYGGIKKKER